MEKEFLHKVNLPMLQKELNMDLAGIAKLVDVSLQTVYRWAWDKSRQGNRPTYNAMKIMLENGATVNTLFGVGEPSAPTGSPVSDEDIEQSVLRALSRIADIKSRGR